MRRTDLCVRLQAKYQDGMDCGVEKGSETGWENIWFVVPPDPPEELPAGMPAEALRRANMVLETLPAAGSIDRTKQLANLLISRSEAVSSSRMEGTWSTVDEVLTPEDDNDEERSNRAAAIGYAIALTKGFEEVAHGGSEAINVPMMRQLHVGAMARDPNYGGEPGALRHPDGPNGGIVVIGGLGDHTRSTYNPAPARHIPSRLEAVANWMSNDLVIQRGDAGQGIPLPARMAIGHAHFEAVHPFYDGNGRVGRILMSLQMVASGRQPLMLSGYAEAERNAYGRSLGRAQKQLIYSDIVEFICEAIVASKREHEKTMTAIMELPTVWRRLAKPRRNSAADKAIDLLARMPIVTARLLEKEMGVSFQAANGALGHLRHAGVVVERTKRRRDRVFAAEEIVRVLSRPFGEDPSHALASARRALTKHPEE